MTSGSRFQRFLFVVTWFCCFRPIVAQYNIVTVCGRGSLSISWMQKERQEVAPDQNPFQEHAPNSSNLLPLGSKS
jgi:hypothetical protein